jgi:hypothetical protein
MVKLPKYFLNEVTGRINDACQQALENEEPRNYLGMSYIGQPCQRRAWLDYHGAPKTEGDPGKLFRIFDMGDKVEAMVKGYLRMAGYTITGEQTEFTDFDGLFRGHCDGIIGGVTQKDHILEIKSANANNFDLMKKDGVRKVKPEYAGQIQCYMGYSGLERGIFVIMNKNTSEIYTERVKFDEKTFESMKNNAKRILFDPKPPEKDEKQCYFCKFKGETCENADNTAICADCKHKISLKTAPVRVLLEKAGLMGCLIGQDSFCAVGEAAGKDGCVSYDKA